jgi:hypothetical protein
MTSNANFDNSATQATFGGGGRSESAAAKPPDANQTVMDAKAFLWGR